MDTQARRLHPALVVVALTLFGCMLGTLIGWAAFGVDVDAAVAEGTRIADAGGGQLAPAGGLLAGTVALTTTVVAMVGGALAGTLTGVAASAIVLVGGVRRRAVDGDEEPA